MAAFLASKALYAIYNIIRVAAVVYSVSSAIQQRRKAKAAARDAAGISTMLKESTAPWSYVYGERRVSGPIVFVQETGTDRKYLQLVIVLAPHEIYEVKKIWVDDISVGPRSDGRVESDRYYNHLKVWTTLGQPGQVAFPSLISRCPGQWTSNHRLDGCAALHVEMLWDQGVYYGGIPNISATVRGKIIRDFIYTDGTQYLWSANPVNVAADLLMDTKIGAGIPFDRLDLATLRAEAAYCQEAVPVTAPAPTDGSVFRYSFHGAINSQEPLANSLDRIAQSMAGAILRSNGKWYVRAGKYRAPSLTLTESDILGTITMLPRRTKADLCNRVRGVFVSEPPDYLFTPTDFPPVKNATYLAQDNNEELWADLDLPDTRCPAQAQRLAKIHLERSRQQIQVSFDVGLRGLQVMPTDTVALTLGRYGWASKVFEVVNWKMAMSTGPSDAPLKVTLALQETASTIYDWAAGEETRFDPAPDTALPDPYDVPDPVLPVVERQAQVNADGVWRVQAKVSWTLPDNGYVTGGGSVIARYKLTTDTDWVETSPVPANQVSMTLPALLAGLSYNVEVCNMSSLGTRSEFVACSPASITLAVDTTPPGAITSVVFSPVLREMVPVPATLAPTAIPLATTISWFDPTDSDLAWVDLKSVDTNNPASTSYRYYFVGESPSGQVRIPAGQRFATLWGVMFPTINAHWVFARTVDTSGNASAWTLIATSPLGNVSYITATLRDMANQSSAAVETSGIQIGSTTASSVRKTLASFATAYTATITAAGGSDEAVFDIDISNRGFSTAPDVGEIDLLDLSTANQNRRFIYSQGSSTSTTAKVVMKKLDGGTWGAGNYYHAISANFTEYD